MSIPEAADSGLGILEHVRNAGSRALPPNILNHAPGIRKLTEGGEAALQASGIWQGVQPHHTQPMSFLCVSHHAKSFILSHLIPCRPYKGNTVIPDL